MTNLVMADTFLGSVEGLTQIEKGRVLDFLRKFSQNPSQPGISLERVQRARSDGVWAGRVSQELRAVLYKAGDTWVLLHAAHHDAAYNWAELHEVGPHPVTGALQVVEVVTAAPTAVVSTAPPIGAGARAAPPPPAPLFAAHADAYLSSLGVPPTWLAVIREIREEDQLIQVCAKLPSDVGERLLKVAMGELVTPPAPVPVGVSLAATPEGQQQFRVVDDEAELKAILEAPLQKWIAFLHPTQRRIVEAKAKGPMKVTGSAGTGKTTVALHRARHLARAGKRVLLTTYVSTLAANLQRTLRLFCSEAELARIEASTVHSAALRVSRQQDVAISPAKPEDVRATLDMMRLRHGPALSPEFVRDEWEGVVQRQGLLSWDEYRSARRLGRGKPLSVAERKALWKVFGATLEDLSARRKWFWPFLSRRAELAIASGDVKSPWDAVLVDETQDLMPPDLRFLAVASGGELTLLGDAGQRIYAAGFSLSALGIDVRGRSHVLRLNYRTTEQIRKAADAVLGEVEDDLDDGRESRRGTRSLLRGPDPIVQRRETWASEVDAAVKRVRGWIERGVPADAVAVFARTRQRAREVGEALERGGLPVAALEAEDGGEQHGVAVGTMHRAKGLEFRSVLLVDASAAALPSPAALAACADEVAREETIEKERRLLYVAMTRARDELAITWSGLHSRFLEPLLSGRSNIG